MGSPPEDRKIIQVRVLRLSEAAILFFSLFFLCSFFFLDLDALDLAPIGNVALYLAMTLSRSSTRCRTFKPTWDFIEWRCSALKLCKQLRPVFSLPLSVKRLLSCFSNLGQLGCDSIKLVLDIICLFFATSDVAVIMGSWLVLLSEKPSCTSRVVG